MADTREYLTWARTLAHRRRVEHARAALLKARSVGPIVVSTSWGKDSCALGALAVAVVPDVEFVHLSSPYELPGGEPVVQWFSARAPVHVIQAKNLEVVIRELHDIGGPAILRERSGDRRGKKIAGLKDWFRQRSPDTVCAMGLRADESKIRKIVFRSRGAVYQRLSGWATIPLATWSVKDVWAYLFANGVPYHPLYDLETHGYTREDLRNGGWLTLPALAGDDRRVPWLAQHYPEQWSVLCREWPRLRMML